MLTPKHRDNQGTHRKEVYQLPHPRRDIELEMIKSEIEISKGVSEIAEAAACQRPIPQSHTPNIKARFQRFSKALRLRICLAIVRESASSHSPKADDVAKIWNVLVFRFKL